MISGILNLLLDRLVLEIDHLNNYVLLKNEVVAFSHQVLSDN
jgi:hypothetical protein